MPIPYCRGIDWAVISTRGERLRGHRAVEMTLFGPSGCNTLSGDDQDDAKHFDDVFSQRQDHQKKSCHGESNVKSNEQPTCG
jgi:hypothetical protein